MCLELRSCNNIGASHGKYGFYGFKPYLLIIKGYISEESYLIKKTMPHQDFML
jgi:hypothetical protein